MLFEVQAEIKGELVLDGEIEFKKYPYTITIFSKDGKYYISFRKKLVNFEGCIPTLTKEENGIPTITFPPGDFYLDAIKTIKHIESFGAVDNRLESIDTQNLILKWIPENDNEHISPFTEVQKRRGHEKSRTKTTHTWLQDTVISEKQMEDLFIPFAFYRDASNLFQNSRYQSAFCTYYMMLEYFFHEKKWGIENDAYKRKKCLKTSLRKTLETLQTYEQHYEWLINELKRRNKKYDEAGLLFLINRFRDELSHAVDKSRNRNIFNDLTFFSLAFIAMNVCLYVTIKKRLSPFVVKKNSENFSES